MHLMRGYADFDIKMEERILMNSKSSDGCSFSAQLMTGLALQSLKEFWDDRRGDFPFPHELEMRLYHRLVHIRDTSSRPEAIPEHITSHPVFQLVTRFRAHVQAISAPIRRDSKLVVDEEGMSIFRELAASLMSHTNRVVMYLVACVMEGVFGEGTIEDIDAIKGDLTVQEIIDGVEKPFSEEVSAVADSYDEVQTEIQDAAPVNNLRTDERSNAAPQAPPAGSWFSSNQQPTPLTAMPKPLPPSAAPMTTTQSSLPVKSAFGNLVSTPNAFGITFPLNTPAAPSGTATSQATFPVSSSSSSSALMHPMAHSAELSTPNLVPQIHAKLKPNNADLSSQSSLASISDHPSNSFNPNHAIAPTRPTALNPTAGIFTPRSTLSHSKPEASSLGSATPPVSNSIPSINGHQVVGSPAPLIAVPTLPASAFTMPPPATNMGSSAPLAVNQQSDPHIVDRRQTLWDLPSTTPASIADIKSLTPSASPSSTRNGAQTSPSKLDSGGIPISPMEPPLLNKPALMSLPPTPTARWFDPSSLTGAAKPQDLSLSLRKQSLGLLGLQMPSTPSPAEILSPLTLGTPQTEIPHTAEESSPTPAGPVASTSRMLLPDSEPSSPTTEPKGKGRATRAEMKELASAFARRGSSVRTCFKLWVKKTMDKAEWAEACVRSDMYKETVHRQRISSGTALPARPKSPSSSEVRNHAQKRRKPRGSGHYIAPVTDEELVKRLKEVSIYHPLSNKKNKLMSVII
jgi:nuclear mRNA export protein SAC3